MSSASEERFAILNRRRLVADMYLRGTAQYLIAHQVGVHKSQITRDLEFIRREWMASAIRDFDAAKAEQLAKIDRLEQENWDAWERSKAVAEVRTAKTIRDADGERTEASKREEGQVGDPRFLTGVERCIELRCKLLGIISTKLEHSGPDGGPIPMEVREIVVRTRSEAAAVISALSGAAAVLGRN